MRLLKTLATGTTLAAALALSACIDVEMDIAVLGPDQVRVSGFTQMPLEMVDMVGGAEGFCDAEDGGTIVMTDTHARCELLMESDFAAAFPDADEAGDEGSPSITDLGDGTAVVRVPLGDATGDMGEMMEDPNMIAMMRPMMEGHGLRFSVSGSEIVSTNGTLSDDGTRATLEFPLTDLLDPENDLPAVFETIVRY